MFHISGAQNGSAALTPVPTATTPAAAASSTPVVPPADPAAPAPVSAESSGNMNATLIMDYKSVYETATVEEEVKMAAERFSLTPEQQDIWLTAATDRRLAEKQVSDKLANSKEGDYDKNGVYRGLRTSHNTFHETITGYLSPTQKQALERDRLILNEKQKRMAKLPPPPPPAPTVTVAPVDSAAIKEPETGKKKSKKKKKKA